MNDSYLSILDALGLSQLPCQVKFTRDNLRFFELGAFIQTCDECWIEINPKIKPGLFGYDFELVLTHELIHAIRKDFEDSIFEELIAYHICKKKYQRICGPYFSKKTNQMLVFLSPIAVLGIWSFCIWVTLILGTVIRYSHEYKVFQSVLKNFLETGLNSKEAFQKILRLDKSQILESSKKATTRVRNL